MTRTDLLAWLDRRRPAPPDGLRARLVAAVTDSPLPLAEHLAELGQRLLERVAARPAGGRELALDLLAADAFVTYAFEAQAEAQVGGLERLAEGVRV
ncbi:MAG TPA: hypothetical protein VGQ06_09525 [Gemmatimonadales bacterium]|nr:hypothetical protein [Gemmatimonadales bacterium]